MKNDYDKYKENLGTEWLINPTDGILFYEYPENPVYWISKCGKVYNSDSEFILSTSIIQSGKGYYTVTINNKRTRVHRMLAITFLNNPSNYPIVDHISKDTLDNSLENLRWVTQSMNCRNRTKKAGTKSKFVGVRKLKNGTFAADIHIPERKRRIGTYPTEELAAEAYNKVAAQYGILHLNKIEENDE